MRIDTRAMRGALMAGSGLAMLACASAAAAQATAAEPALATPTTSDAPVAAAAPAPVTEPAAQAGGLEEIVVTAQRREQRLQDVPIAITALTQERLEANRILNVTDLSGQAPGLVARQTTGGIGIASFTMRGVTSYGVVPGSDKEISIYLDGVYISATRASIFDLPDIARLEVLRGPQGTLFGRNATAGAISIVTRDPTGEFHVKQDLTVGNYDQFRSRTSVDLPAVGPFSAYVTYVHDERRGDMRNTGAGTVWDYSSPNSGQGIKVSPKYLGDKNNESVFAAVKFDPGGDFTTVYKFDYAENDFTPEGSAAVAYVPGGAARLVGGSLGAAAPFYGAYIDAIIQGSGAQFNPEARRPKSVNNNWTTPGFQRNYGHSLTSNLRLSDNLSVKNVAAYRKSYVYSSSQFDGLGARTIPQSALLPFAGLVGATTVPGFTSFPAATQAFIASQIALNPQVAAAAGIGNRFLLFSGANEATAKQWSDELQFNYDSEPVTVTAGGIWFHSKDVTGGFPDLQNTLTFATFNTAGQFPIGRTASSPNGQGIFFNKATSLAGYVQVEGHLTEQLDIVAGGRYTHDRKSGRNEIGGIFVPSATTPADRTQGSITGITGTSFRYRKGKFTYSIGANYKPNEDILLYAKYSTGFVSGGTVADFGFAPETVKSPEAGIKADWFDRRLRTNLALWYAKYDNFQSAQGGPAVGRPDLSVVVAQIGGLKAKGAEFETTIAPGSGFTLGASLAYTDAKFTNPPAYLLASSLGAYVVTLQPKWSSNMFAEYASPQPLFAGGQFYARADATWRSRMRFDANPNIENILPQFASSEFSPASWIVNGRVALRGIETGLGKFEVAVWGRNLNNNRAGTFANSLPFTTRSLTFERARTYGLDVKFAF